MHTPDDRIEELVAAAVAGDRSPREEDELRRLAAAHPWVDVEIERLRAIAARVEDADVAWIDAPVTAALRERILGEIAAPAVGPARPRRVWVSPLIGAACLAVGLALGAGLPALSSLPPSGPPGTLGAYEQVAVAANDGVRVETDLVAHTWGTEAVIDATGLTVGAIYRVVFIAEDGTEFPAGEMLGSPVAIHCRLNAAVLREETVRLEIRDASSAVVASADLPAA